MRTLAAWTFAALGLSIITYMIPMIARNAIIIADQPLAGMHSGDFTVEMTEK